MGYLMLHGRYQGPERTGAWNFLWVKGLSHTPKVWYCTTFFAPKSFFWDEKSPFWTEKQTVSRTILHHDRCIAPFAGNSWVQMHPHCRCPWVKFRLCNMRKKDYHDDQDLLFSLGDSSISLSVSFSGSSSSLNSNWWPKKLSAPTSSAAVVK